MTMYRGRKGRHTLLVVSLVSMMFFNPAVTFAEEGGAESEVVDQQSTLVVDEVTSLSESATEGTEIDGGEMEVSISASTDEALEIESAVDEDESALQTTEASATTNNQTAEAGAYGATTTNLNTTSGSSTTYETVGSTTAGTSTTENGTHGDDGNTSSSTSTENTEIVSGTSIALANVLNLVNTNFVNSNGVVVFENFFSTLLDDFDLRDYYASLQALGTCSLSGCTSDGVKTNISNGAVIDNSLYVQAESGSNLIDGSNNATITTGNAYAGVNLINVANTNIIDSNYLLVTMNAFEDVNGDIIFPSLTNFFRGLGGVASDSSINITNAADVANNINLTASAGGNSTDVAGSSTIKTGESHSSANAFNQINTSLIGGQSVSLLFRVHGAWAGEIFGAPDNLAWFEDGAGGIYMFDKDGSTGNGTNHLGINATNTVSINNNVNVVALTGDNAVTGSETALISTGNAYAGANIVNVANATVVGRNWILAIINIFGDFHGNISFGRPDLWVGGQASVPSKVADESDVKYTLTVINNGDAPASNVTLVDEYDSAHLDIHDASATYTAREDGKLEWNLPDLPPGQATEISYYGRVKNTTYSTDIVNTVTVRSVESDNNNTDNTDSIVISTDSKSSRNGSGVKISLSSPHSNSTSEVLGAQSNAFEVTRVTSSSTVGEKSARTVKQALILENTTNKSIANVVLHDILYAPNGEMLKDEVWNLGVVLPHERVEIAYTIQFKENAASGFYTLGTRIESGNMVLREYLRNGTVSVAEEVKLAFTFQLSTTATFADVGATHEVTEEVDIEVGVNDQGSKLLSTLAPKVAEASSPLSLPTDENPSSNYTVLALLFAFAILAVYARMVGVL